MKLALTTIALALLTGCLITPTHGYLRTVPAGHVSAHPQLTASPTTQHPSSPARLRAIPPPTTPSLIPPQLLTQLPGVGGGIAGTIGILGALRFIAARTRTRIDDQISAALDRTAHATGLPVQPPDAKG